MITKSYKVEFADSSRLRAILAEIEAEVDGLSDDELAHEEQKLEMRIKTFLDFQQSPRSLIFDRKSWKFPRMYAGGLAFLAAAVTLMVVRPLPDSMDETQVRIKGLAETQMQCQLNWVQADRSSPEGDELGLALQKDLPTYLEIRCPKTAFVHAGYRKDGQLIWLVQNQALNEGRAWLQDGQELVDFTAALGYEATLFVSSKALDKNELTRISAADNAQQLVVWQETIALRPRLNAGPAEIAPSK